MSCYCLGMRSCFDSTLRLEGGSKSPSNSGNKMCVYASYIYHQIIMHNCNTWSVYNYIKIYIFSCAKSTFLRQFLALMQNPALLNAFSSHEESLCSSPSLQSCKKHIEISPRRAFSFDAASGFLILPFWNHKPHSCMWGLCEPLCRDSKAVSACLICSHTICKSALLCRAIGLCAASA